MKPESTNQIKNNLALFRRRRLMEPKQVAKLLGLQAAEQISRFENGTVTPNLKSALKLAAIYKIPIRILLDGYYNLCLREVREEQAKLTDPKNATALAQGGDDEFEFCTLEEKLSSRYVTAADLDKVRKHSAELIRKRGEELNHY